MKMTQHAYHNSTILTVVAMLPRTSNYRCKHFIRGMFVCTTSYRWIPDLVEVTSKPLNGVFLSIPVKVESVIWGTVFHVICSFCHVRLKLWICMSSDLSSVLPLLLLIVHFPFSITHKHLSMTRNEEQSMHDPSIEH